MVTTTGKSLRDLNSRDLFDAAYFLMTERSIGTEEELEALDKLNDQIEGWAFEATTGMPSISRWMRPANEI